MNRKPKDRERTLDELELEMLEELLLRPHASELSMSVWCPNGGGVHVKATIAELTPMLRRQRDKVKAAMDSKVKGS